MNWPGLRILSSTCCSRAPTRRPTARDIAESIEGKGGVFNASTGLETTLYWAKVATAHLPEALDVLSDMLLNATFDAEEMEKERAVIAEEINYSLTMPASLAQMRANELQWPGHPLGRDVAGTQQSVAEISRQALLDFRAAHYRPGETILSVAGPVSHEELLSLVESNLAGWEPGPQMHVRSRSHLQTVRAIPGYSWRPRTRIRPRSA